MQKQKDHHRILRFFWVKVERREAKNGIGMYSIFSNHLFGLNADTSFKGVRDLPQKLQSDLKGNKV